MSTADSSHGLDRLFTAHLPEFIQILSAGLSPIKQHKQVKVDRADHEHSASRANCSPTASGVSSGIQRSFSAVQLHNPGLSMPGQQLPQQHWAAHKRTASTDAMASCWTDGCSSGSPDGDADCTPCSSTGSASPEVNSAAAGGSSILLRTGWHAGGSAPDVPPAAATAAGQVPLLQQKRLPPCPVLWRPAPSLVRGVPVAEGVEEPDGSPAQCNRPATSTADTSEQQQYLGARNAAAAPAVAEEQQQQQQQQQPDASVPSSPDLRSSRSSYVRSSSIANLMQALHGLLGTSGGSSTGVKLQVQAPAESQGLDMHEYINCYSPDATTRGHSRTSSRAQEVQQISSNRSSPSASPRASGSFPDLRLFWSNYSQGGSKVPSRQSSSAAVLRQQVMQQPHVEQSELSGAQAEQQQQQLEQTQQPLPQTRQVAVANPAAVLPAADVAADAAADVSSSADAQAGARKVLPQSPSPSKRSILLHGPSRLSLRTSMQDAAAAATGRAQQALTADAQHSAVAVGLPQEQPAGPLQQHAGRLPRRSETEAVAAETVPLAAGQDGPGLSPQDQQVQRQLFAPQEAGPSTAQAPRQQQVVQQQQVLQEARAAQPAPAVSPSKKQSMLWSLMHRKGSGSQLAPTAPTAVADSSGGTPVDKGAGAVVSADTQSSYMQALSTANAASNQTGEVAHDLAAVGQQLQAAQQPGAPTAAGVVSASPALGVLPATGLATSSNAADVVASSMERIASCLEDFLCDRSPSVSPTRDRQGMVHGQHTSHPYAAATAATGVAGAHGSPGHAGDRDQGQGYSSSTAGDAAQHVTPQKAAASWTDGRRAAEAALNWSPAAAAARARMMAALSPGKLQLEVTQPAAGRDIGPGAQLPQGDQDNRKRDSGAAAGWLHPGDLRPAGAAEAHAAGRLQQSGHQLSNPIALQQNQQQAASLSQLPRGLRAPPGLGLNSQQQQQQQQQQPVAQSRHAKVAQQQTAAAGTAPGGGDELASLFALACRAVGVDLLGDSQQAAAPAVTAAALTAAMAAAATAYQQQIGQQPHHQAAPPSARALSAAAAAAASQDVQQRRHTAGAWLWRPQGGVALGAEQPSAIATCGSSSAGVDATWHASMTAGAVASGDAHLVLQHDMPALEQQHGSGQFTSGGKLWQQQQQPVHGQQAAAKLSLASIRTLQPERASQLRLLRPGQPDLQSAEDHLYGSWPTHGSGLGAAHQQQQPWSRPWQAAGGSSSVQGASRGPKLVRLPVQQQPAVPLRPHVLSCCVSASSSMPTAPWLHPAANDMQGDKAQPAVSHAVNVDANRPTQHLAPWQSVGQARHAVPAIRNQPAVQEGAAGRALGGSGLCAGAAAARLLQGMADPDPGAGVSNRHGSRHFNQPGRPLAAMTGAPVGYQDSWADKAADGCKVSLRCGPSGPHLQHPADALVSPARQMSIHYTSSTGANAYAYGAGMRVSNLKWQPLRVPTEASTAATKGAVQKHHQPEWPVQPVVIEAPRTSQQQQQQQRAPWQLDVQQRIALNVEQAPVDQPKPTAAEAAQQPQQWQVTFPPPHSPIKSPRKHPVGRRWALLQKLKAVNRGKATAAAARPGQADAAAQLVAQLQQLMQGPAAAMQGPAEVSSRRDNWKPDLDAAAAMALHAGPQQQAVDTAGAQQLQPQGQEVQGAGLPEQVSVGAGGSRPLSAQASMHSAAAQTSGALGADPSASMADAAVQAASASAEAGTESEQQQQGQGGRQQGALELAQLILGAFDEAGGMISPDGVNEAASSVPVTGAGDDGAVDLVPGATQQLHQGSSWGLLPNPFAGPAAPQFCQVVDLRPNAMLADSQTLEPYPEHSQHAEQEADQPEVVQPGLQLDVQGYGVVHEEVQEQPSLQWVSSSGPAQHGCCFAACPRHISSPELGDSKRPQQQRITRRTGSAASSSRRTTAEARSQQQQQRPSSSKALGKVPTGAPSLAPNSRSSSASARQLTANRSQASSSGRLSQTRTGSTGGQREPAQQQQQRRSSTGQQQSGAGQSAGSKAPVSPNTWACEQTKQLDELWQQWHKQQIKVMAASGTQPQQQADVQQQAPALQQQQEQQRKQEQQLRDERERQELEAAYARAAAARASAKKAAQHAAASRSQRLRAELMDLGRMLAEVDTLAAQMEVESNQAAAAVEQFEADLYRSRASLRTSAAGSVGVCAV